MNNPAATASSFRDRLLQCRTVADLADVMQDAKQTIYRAHPHGQDTASLRAALTSYLDRDLNRVIATYGQGRVTGSALDRLIPAIEALISDGITQPTAADYIPPGVNVADETPEPDTRDIGIAIRDALNLYGEDDLERFDWSADDPVTAETVGTFSLGESDASDPSSLIVTTTTGAMFRVAISRI